MKLIYGNPSYESVELIRNSILLREWIQKGVFDELLQNEYPSEDIVKQELLYLLQLSNNLDSARLEKIVRLDRDLFGVMSEFLQSYGINHSKEQVYANIQIYEPIIDYLKIKFNRPRPFQTAAYYGIPLYPKIKTDASDSSYPSGHTLFSLYFYDYYGKLFPELKKDLLEFVFAVKKSREEGGVHYPSDGAFSFKIYKHIKDLM
jgi:membrane-associated phospholipid phosphatase